ncbi:hypothetical protein ABZ639_28380 [Saccharomonospora sp. NPDC006951]
MYKKLGFVAGVAAVSSVLLGGVASAGQAAGGASDLDQHGQVGLVNLNNTDIAHNVNVPVGFCDNNVNVLGVQVPVRDVANGIGVPVLSPGQNAAGSASPYNCSSGTIIDGGSIQDN